MYEKEIVYDPETRDFAMYLDGELVGFARTYQEAEQTLDELIYELLNGTHYVPIKGQHGTSPAA
jgi:hypothetical protein